MIKLIHWELCKGLNVDHSNGIRQNKNMAQKNETHIFLWNFEIETVTQSQRPGQTRPVLVIIKKKKKISRSLFLLFQRTINWKQQKAER